MGFSLYNCTVGKKLMKYQVLFKHSSLQANIQKNNADKQKGYMLIMIL